MALKEKGRGQRRPASQRPQHQQPHKGFDSSDTLAPPAQHAMHACAHLQPAENKSVSRRCAGGSGARRGRNSPPTVSRASQPPRPLTSSSHNDTQNDCCACRRSLANG